MPYPKAHVYVLALIPFVVLGFWPSYFSSVTSAPIGFHVHGISSSLWIFLLAFQSWSIHNKQRIWHRQLGSFGLLLFPVFMCGFFMVFHSQSQNALQADNPISLTFRLGIGSITAIAIITTAYLFYAGLRNRKNVQLHARYMLAIPFLFAESVFGRVFNSYVPGMIVNGIEEIHLAYWGFHLSEILAIAFAMYLYLRERRHGQPFLIVGIAMLLQSITLESFGHFDWWRDVFLDVADVSVIGIAISGIGAGVIIAWLGWAAPGRHRRQQVTAGQ